jgi:hypothetical protein
MKEQPAVGEFGQSPDDASKKKPRGGVLDVRCRGSLIGK